MIYPSSFENLIKALESLPSVGNKTATRFAFSILENKNGQIETLKDALSNLKQVHYCKTCGFLTDLEECQICRDKNRNDSTLMVVAYPQDVIALEKLETYKGKYHVLNGLISANKGIYPEDININSLLNRINENTKEVIIALSSTLDGEMTALYIDKILKEKNVLVTRLATGLAMGTNLDYADDLTLLKALNNRLKIEDE